MINKHILQKNLGFFIDTKGSMEVAESPLQCDQIWRKIATLAKW